MSNLVSRALCYNAGSLLSLLLTFLIWRQLWDSPHTVPSSYYPSSTTSADIACQPIPGVEDVLVVLKTSATEALEKVPIHFDTTLRCIPHFVIFSDLDEHIAGHHVYDVLEDIDQDVKRTHPDFELYRRVQERGRQSPQLDERREWSMVSNTDVGDLDSSTWRLDKWKFLPLIEKSFRHRPEAKWFVFMETDTCMLWPNLMKWLSHVDSSKPYYFGSPAQNGDMVCGHGSSGLIISNPAMQKVAEHREAHGEYYHEYTASQWAGACVLGKAMRNAGVSMTWSWPHLQSAEISTLDFGRVRHNKKIWCYEAVSYTHRNTEDALAFWKFEQEWNRQVDATMLAFEQSLIRIQDRSTLRHKDVFQHLVLPKLVPERHNWNNLAETPVAHRDSQHGMESFESCRKACETRKDCMQYSYSYPSCRVSSAIRLGHKDTSSEHGMVRSGWMMDRVEARARNIGACKKEQWLLT